MDCFEYIDSGLNITAPYELLFLTAPTVNSFIWAQRSVAWDYAFITYTAVFSAIFFVLGFMSVVMLFKQDCIRLKTKTFLAIYICIAILGFSHAIQLSLDPFGILGWLLKYFPQWNIISRFLIVLGFPSLTASYMLIFITLYKSVDIGASRLWHQDWRVVSLLVAGHYIIAITAEAIANTANYPALGAIIICQASYAVWDVFICTIYLIAGCRLLRRLKAQCEASVRMSSSISTPSRDVWRRTGRQESQSVLSDEHYNRQYNKISQTLRKVAIITYFTSFFSVLHALISITSLFFMSWFVFYQCFGLNGVGDPVIWLVLQIALKMVEILLAMVMIYSVTDLKAIWVVFSNCCCLHKPTGTNHCTDSTGPTTIPHTASQSSLASISNTRTDLTQSTKAIIRPHPPIVIHSSMEDSV